MRKYDLFLIAALLILGAALYPMLISRTEAGRATVYSAGEPVYTCSLAEEGSYTWTNGDNFVQIDISGGGARISASSCPDQSCVHRGWQNRSGTSIICLPNAISVLLEGNGEEEHMDAILY